MRFGFTWTFSMLIADYNYCVFTFGASIKSTGYLSRYAFGGGGIDP